MFRKETAFKRAIARIPNNGDVNMTVMNPEKSFRVRELIIFEMKHAHSRNIFPRNLAFVQKSILRFRLSKTNHENIYARNDAN